jgi:hypothetical protein
MTCAWHRLNRQRAAATVAAQGQLQETVQRMHEQEHKVRLLRMYLSTDSTVQQAPSY